MIDGRSNGNMKMVGIIMLVLAVIILLVGIISPLNIFVCALFAGVFFLLGGIIIKRHK